MDMITREQFALYAVTAFSEKKNKSLSYVGNAIGYGGHLHLKLSTTSVSQQVVDKVIDFVGKELRKTKEKLWEEAIVWNNAQAVAKNDNKLQKPKRGFDNA